MWVGGYECVDTGVDMHMFCMQVCWVCFCEPILQNYNSVPSVLIPLYHRS